MVVDADAVVYPRAVAERTVSECDSTTHTHEQRHLLILPRHTASATPAVLAPQRLPYHTWCSEVLLVKDAAVKQLVDRPLCLATTAAFGNVTRIRSLGHEVKVRSKAVEYHECNVEEEISVQGIWGKRNQLSLQSVVGG